MKYTAALTLALAAMALATPTPANDAKAAAKGNGGGGGAAAAAKGKAAGAADAQQVQDSVDKWLQDIKDVNTFVDTALSLKSNQEISDAAATAFIAAQDEGTQNDFLAGAVQLDSIGALANKDLANQFGIIGPAINDTISNPQNLQKNLDAINGARYVIHPNSFYNHFLDLLLIVENSCPPPVGDGAIIEEGTVQQAAAQAVGATADAPEIPDACNA